jgi:hypothetical protein
MDNTTLLEVIKMLDTKIWNTVAPNKALRVDDIRVAALIQFRDHLQSHIEAQLNAVELETGE